MVNLAFTDGAFRHHGGPLTGVPVLLNEDMRLVEGPQRWLFYIALDRGRTRSPATWRSYLDTQGIVSVSVMRTPGGTPQPSSCSAPLPAGSSGIAL